MISSDTTFCVFTLGLQLVGVASVAAARLWEHTSAGPWYRWLCFTLLGMVGLAAAASIAWESGCWRTCGVTMAIMAVGATLDMRGTRHAEAF